MIGKKVDKYALCLVQFYKNKFLDKLEETQRLEELEKNNGVSANDIIPTVEGRVRSV